MVEHRITPRDKQYCALVDELGVCTHQMVHTAVHDGFWDGHSQGRMTMLVRQKLLRVSRPANPNQPLIYYTDPQYIKRNGSLPHMLAINELRVRLIHASRKLRFVLQWKSSEALIHALTEFHLIPDGCFLIRREARQSLFFVELEYSSRAKGSITQKLLKYQQLYDDEKSYRTLFGTYTICVLVVYASPHGINQVNRVKQAVAEAENCDASFLRATTLESITSCLPVELLTKPIWSVPYQAEQASILPVSD